MKTEEMLKILENKERELSTYKEKDKDTVRKLCTDKNKKIIEFYEVYAIENILNELDRLQKENEELENINEQHRKLNGELREEINELKASSGGV